MLQLEARSLLEDALSLPCLHSEAGCMECSLQALCAVLCAVSSSALQWCAGAERRITLSSIRAPRVGRRDEKSEPWALEARELLRSTLIGVLPVSGWDQSRCCDACASNCSTDWSVQARLCPGRKRRVVQPASCSYRMGATASDCCSLLEHGCVAARGPELCSDQMPAATLGCLVQARRSG